jgi:hypothetical protein
MEARSIISIATPGSDVKMYRPLAGAIADFALEGICEVDVRGESGIRA